MSDHYHTADQADRCLSFSIVLKPEFAGCGNENVLGSGKDAGCSSKEKR